MPTRIVPPALMGPGSDAPQSTIDLHRRTVVAFQNLVAQINSNIANLNPASPVSFAGGFSTVTSTSTGTGTGGGGVAPLPIVALVIDSSSLDPRTNVASLTFHITPPGGTFTGVHLYAEIPDQSDVVTFVTNTSTTDSAAKTQGIWAPIDLGKYTITTETLNITFHVPDGLNLTHDILSRLYASSFNTDVENALVRAGLSGATPNTTFTLRSTVAAPAAATNITTLSVAAGGLVGIVATALAPDNTTGKLVTPVIVLVSDTPVQPGWCFRLLVTLGNADPTLKANQQVVSGVCTDAGPVPLNAATPDNIAVPHSFVLDTPKAVQTATVWLQAGLVGGDRKSHGVFVGNNIVPGITPSWTFTYGSTVGTTDASAIMTATIAARMAITAGLLDIAISGVTNAFIGPGAVATINLDALAVTNPKLAALAVQATNLASGSVTAGNAALATLAVGTAAIQTGAITFALMANAAIGAANIINGTITFAQIANATIAGANIGTATITDANIFSVNASKITAGTISATISITSPTINGGTITGASITLNASGVTTTINNGGASWGGVTGLKIRDNSTGDYFATDNNFGGYFDSSDNAVICFNRIQGRIQLKEPVGSTHPGQNRATLYNTGLLELSDTNGVIHVALSGGGTSIPGAVKIDGLQVVGPRSGTTPTTLAQVITILQTHGLCS